MGCGHADRTLSESDWVNTFSMAKVGRVAIICSYEQLGPTDSAPTLCRMNQKLGHALTCEKPKSFKVWYESAAYAAHLGIVKAVPLRGP